MKKRNASNPKIWLAGLAMVFASLLLPAEGQAAPGGTVIECPYLKLEEISHFSESGWIGVTVDVLDSAGTTLANDRMWVLCKTKIDSAERADLQVNEGFREWVTEADCINILGNLQLALAGGFKLTVVFQGAPDTVNPSVEAQSCESVDDWNSNLFKHIKRVGVAPP